MRCVDKCGSETIDEEAAMASSWSFLSITASWRCGDCARKLREASGFQGTTLDPAFNDRIDPHSTGALTKKTRESITPPVVNPNPKGQRP